MFEVELAFPIDGDKEALMGLVGMLARDLPNAMHPSSGLSRLKPRHSALLVLEVYGENGAEAVEEAISKLRIALELRGKPVPECFQVRVEPLAAEVLP
jgi:hypothetical protein